MEYCTWSCIQANEGCDDAVSEPDAYPSLPPWKSKLYHRRHNHPPIICYVWPSCHKKPTYWRWSCQLSSYPFGVIVRDNVANIEWTHKATKLMPPHCRFFGGVGARSSFYQGPSVDPLEGKVYKEQTAKKSCLYVSPGGWGTWSFCKRLILRGRKNTGEWFYDYIHI